MSDTATRARSDAVSAAVDEARALYASRRPRTSALHERARAVLPGGNTRSVLYHRPFPLRIARAWEAMLEDADGHRYVDLLGEYSAGLYGHSNPVVIKAMTDGLKYAGRYGRSGTGQQRAAAQRCIAHAGRIPL